MNSGGTKWAVWKINRKTAQETKKLKKQKAGPDAFQELEWSEHNAIEDAEKDFAYRVGQRLRRQAIDLDVEMPPLSDTTMWYKDEDYGVAYFTTKGRAHVRKLVDAEKARRFEVKTLWVTKIIIPLASLVIGILGAITAIVAVSHKTPEPKQNGPDSSC